MESMTNGQVLQSLPSWLIILDHFGTPLIARVTTVHVVGTRHCHVALHYEKGGGWRWPHQCNLGRAFQRWLHSHMRYCSWVL